MWKQIRNWLMTETPAAPPEPDAAAIDAAAHGIVQRLSDLLKPYGEELDRPEAYRHDFAEMLKSRVQGMYVELELLDTSKIIFFRQRITARRNGATFDIAPATVQSPVIANYLSKRIVVSPILAPRKNLILTWGERVDLASDIQHQFADGSSMAPTLLQAVRVTSVNDDNRIAHGEFYKNGATVPVTLKLSGSQSVRLDDFVSAYLMVGARGLQGRVVRVIPGAGLTS